MKTTPMLCVAALAAALVSPARAQLTPHRLYNGIDRGVLIDVAVPSGLDGDAEVRLYRPGEEAAAGTAPVAAGEIDLAGKFGFLWKPPADPQFFYAQLVVGETPVGPPLVLQPMVSPKAVVIDPQSRRPKFQEFGATFSGYRIYADKHVIFDTSEGEVEFRLRPDEAPNTAWNFRQLVAGGYYDGIEFHRIIGERSGRPAFVVQVGDPTGTGSGGPGYFIDLEDSTIPHDIGVLSMARTNDPNSGGAQVFVCLSRAGTSFLDGSYTAFAEAVRGAEAIRAIAAVPVDSRDRPSGTAPTIRSARLVDAPAYGTGPGPLSEQQDER